MSNSNSNSNYKYDYKCIKYSKEKHVGWVILSRPEALNALNAELLGELDHLLTEVIDKDQELRVLVITGDGEKAFVAGADIKEMVDMKHEEALRLARRGQRIFMRLEKLPIPVIASVNGFALGGGFELALACDFIVAAQQAQFGLPETNLGLMPGFGGTVRLSRRIGPTLARVAIYTGQKYSAQEALQMGIVHKLVDREQLRGTVQELAENIASRAPHSIAAIKQSIFQSETLSIESAMEIEAQAFAGLFTTADQKEGVRAFLEKRKPQFQGR